jgi:hypothetical protein
MNAVTHARAALGTCSAVPGTGYGLVRFGWSCTVGAVLSLLLWKQVQLVFLSCCSSGACQAAGTTRVCCCAPTANTSK